MPFERRSGVYEGSGPQRRPGFGAGWSLEARGRQRRLVASRRSRASATSGSRRGWKRSAPSAPPAPIQGAIEQRTELPERFVEGRHGADRIPSVSAGAEALKSSPASGGGLNRDLTLPREGPLPSPREHLALGPRVRTRRRAAACRLRHRDSVQLSADRPDELTLALQGGRRRPPASEPGPSCAPSPWLCRSLSMFTAHAASAQVGLSPRVRRCFGEPRCRAARAGSIRLGGAPVTSTATGPRHRHCPPRRRSNACDADCVGVLCATGQPGFHGRSLRSFWPADCHAPSQWFSGNEYDFGHALAAGDFNGDGIDDLAVGVPG